MPEASVDTVRTTMTDGLTLLEEYVAAKKNAEAVANEIAHELDAARVIAANAIAKAKATFDSASAKATTTLKEREAELGERRNVATQAERARLAAVNEYHQRTGINLMNLLASTSGGRTSL